MPVNRKGWATDDKIVGGSKNDTLASLAGDDILIGNAGDDILNGGPGDDILRGGPGNDTHRGGPGSDALTDAAGNNVYKFDPSDALKTCPACDQISGFRSGVDKIDLLSLRAVGGAHLVFRGAADSPVRKARSDSDGRQEKHSLRRN